MDRVAEAVGMDPVELRMLNAYRDGDMKAHRREAKNTALIECMQVAAEKSGWQIADTFKQMSSVKGGGGERALIPDTVTDQDGKIGSSRLSRGGSAPAQATSLASSGGGSVPARSVYSPSTNGGSVPAQPVFSAPPPPAPMTVPTYQTAGQPSSAQSGTSSTATQSGTPPAATSSGASNAATGAPASAPSSRKPDTPRSKARFSSLIGTRRR